MTWKTARSIHLGLCLALLATVPLFAADIPLKNWNAPATYTAGQGRLRTESGELGGGPSPFFPVTPCRQYDSRSQSVLLDNTPRTVTLTGAPCGIPANTLAVSVNITVFNIAAAPSNGVFKVGISSPPTTAWINYPPTESQRANAGVVPTNGNAIVVQVNQGAGSVDFVVDVNGYYFSGSQQMPAGDFFAIRGSRDGGGTLVAVNNSSAPNSDAVVGFLNGNGTFSAAVMGTSSSAGPISGVKGVLTNASPVSNSAGVIGINGPGAFQSFYNADPAGVVGINSSNGVLGISQERSVIGVLVDSGGTADIAEGYLGTAGPDPGMSFGVVGQLLSTAAGNGSAGVVGVSSGGPTSVYNAFVPVGVAGLAGPGGPDGRGVGGLSDSLEAVQGRHLSSGSTTTIGGLGCDNTTAVCGTGDLNVTGTKSFVEPHPYDASKVIKYVAIEGPRPDTYFRGSGRISGGKAVIHVPDDFRMVTGDAGLTVQLTPVGALATLAVESQDLNHIVVLGSKDVTFHYFVQGARRGYEHWQTIQDGVFYRPDSPEERWPNALSPAQKERLVANGTFNPDGTVNLETARRLGWVEQWEKERKGAPPARLTKK